MQVRYSAARGLSLRPVLALLAALVLAAPPAAANSPAATKQDLKPRGRETGLPVPRFVSLKARDARMRIGPSFDYATRWIYVAPGLPMEIIAEYANWRQVRDCDGMTGWMHRSLLSSRRTALVGAWLRQPVNLRASASDRARALALLEPRVRLSVSACDGSWCHVAVPGHDVEGSLKQEALCGVYPHERFP